MLIQELRIGNWITYPKYWGDTPIRVTGVSVVDRRDDESGIYEEFLSLLGNDFLTSDNFNSFVDYKNGVIKVEEIEPIPLTEEWLLKFGFHLDPYKNFELNNININRLNFKLTIFEDDDRYDIPIKTKYVHQLQNLYFALTGEELIIK
jgi:hypothetical protein